MMMTANTPTLSILIAALDLCHHGSDEEFGTWCDNNPNAWGALLMCALSYELPLEALTTELLQTWYRTIFTPTRRLH